MSWFNPEYEFTCERCGAVWYMTKKEIKEAHEAAKNSTTLKIQRHGTLNLKKRNALTSQIALLERTALNDKKCASCGSREISRIKL